MIHREILWWRDISLGLLDMTLSSMNDDIAPMIQRCGAWQMMFIQGEMKFGHFRTRCCSFWRYCTHPAPPPYRSRNFSGIASDAEWHDRSCFVSRRLAIRSTFGVRLSTTALVECLVQTVSVIGTSAQLLRFLFRFLGPSMGRFDRRVRSVYDRTRCL